MYASVDLGTEVVSKAFRSKRSSFARTSTKVPNPLLLMPHYENETTVTRLPSRHRASWGALFAGLVVASGIGWLLMLLGTALGWTVADSTDLEALGQGFGIATTLWILVSWLVAYFIGGLLTARLVGSGDTTVGVLHGITLWGIGVLVSVVLATQGISSVLNLGGRALGSAGSAVGSATSALVEGGQNVDWNEMAEEGQEQLSGTGVLTQITAELKRASAEALANVETNGGAQVTADEVRTAIDQMDREALRSVGLALLRGNPENAKNILTSETTLADQEIEAVVSGAATRVQAQVDQFQAQLEQTAETASDYDEGLLWAIFLGAALALAASVAGAALGCQSPGTRFAVISTETLRA